jgi:hypothetical protein
MEENNSLAFSTPMCTIVVGVDEIYLLTPKIPETNDVGRLDEWQPGWTGGLIDE